ncbi:phage tail assembly chaperone [Limimaricola pyoseonensis]|uniref:DUF4376 domain-containing protein n=1 Tax=Limimaricola pyoseonensis TaxID=521013 RepID=A0A1G7GP18_9RHOB|nr:phage tail assembly chaperone [Limimaricola pyoseonensis]SDE89928.1 protein of unknown function [Limimaricola pyoseonensis]
MKWRILNADGSEANVILASEDQVDGFVEPGQTRALISEHDNHESQEWDIVRRERDALLKASDWIEGAELTPEQRAEWRFYRIALRRFPEDLASPYAPILPRLTPLRELDLPSLTEGLKRELVNTVRDWKIEVGFTWRGVAYQYDETSKLRMSGQSVEAKQAIDDGAVPGDLHWCDPDQPFGWIAADNSVTPMDAHECFAFCRAAGAYERAYVFAGVSLKNMTPLPEDWIDGPYWP